MAKPAILVTMKSSTKRLSSSKIESDAKKFGKIFVSLESFKPFGLNFRDFTADKIYAEGHDAYSFEELVKTISNFDNGELGYPLAMAADRAKMMNLQIKCGVKEFTGFGNFIKSEVGMQATKRILNELKLKRRGVTNLDMPTCALINVLQIQKADMAEAVRTAKLSYVAKINDLKRLIKEEEVKQAKAEEYVRGKFYPANKFDVPELKKEYLPNNGDDGFRLAMAEYYNMIKQDKSMEFIKEHKEGLVKFIKHKILQFDTNCDTKQASTFRAYLSIIGEEQVMSLKVENVVVDASENIPKTNCKRHRCK